MSEYSCEHSLRIPCTTTDSFGFFTALKSRGVSYAIIESELRILFHSSDIANMAFGLSLLSPMVSASLCMRRLGWPCVLWRWYASDCTCTVPCFASEPHLSFWTDGTVSQLASRPEFFQSKMPDGFSLLRLSVFIRCYSYKHTLGVPVHFGRVRFLLATNLGRSCMRVAFPSLSYKSVHHTDCFHNLCHARALGGQIQKKFSG